MDFKNGKNKMRKDNIKVSEQLGYKILGVIPSVFLIVGHEFAILELIGYKIHVSVRKKYSWKKLNDFSVVLHKEDILLIQ